jgi:hypothetical protein
MSPARAWARNSSPLFYPLSRNFDRAGFERVDNDDHGSVEDFGAQASLE